MLVPLSRFFFHVVEGQIFVAELTRHQHKGLQRCLAEGLVSGRGSGRKPELHAGDLDPPFQSPMNAG